MGYYINPPNETKEVFLQREGKIIKNIAWEDIPKGYLPVVIVDNGSFTAAGIAYSKREFIHFISSDDRRPKKIYLVEIEKLKLVSDIGDIIE